MRKAIPKSCPKSLAGKSPANAGLFLCPKSRCSTWRGLIQLWGRLSENSWRIDASAELARKLLLLLGGALPTVRTVDPGTEKAAATRHQAPKTRQGLIDGLTLAYQDIWPA
jgi:hypothetical protein